MEKAVLDGHNVLILGQAGTGKTFSIKKLKSLFQVEEAAMTATTGIAASLLPGGQTIHRFLGLMDGRYESEQLVHKIKNDVEMMKVKKNIMSTKVLFIDEISMMSETMFLQIETVLRSIKNPCLPFGGIQIILSGDLWQLKPIPSYTDPGRMLIQTNDFKKLIPHHYILTKVYRQKEGDLIEAVHLTCQGKSNEQVNNLLTRLRRTLPPGPDPIHLFALNYDVDLCNATHLMELEGELMVYKSIDVGTTQDLSRCSSPKNLHLKVSAPVILTANISGKLVNGLQGRITRLHQDSVSVNFPTIGQSVLLTKHDFQIYCPKKKKVPTATLR